MTYLLTYSSSSNGPIVFQLILIPTPYTDVTYGCAWIGVFIVGVACQRIFLRMILFMMAWNQNTHIKNYPMCGHHIQVPLCSSPRATSLGGSTGFSMPTDMTDFLMFK